MRALRSLIESLEGAPISVGGWVVTLASIIGIRHVLEMASGRYPVYTPVQFFVHYPLAYLAPLLALTLLLSAFSRTRPLRVAKLMLFAWVLTLLPPLVDLAIGHSHGQHIGYLVTPGVEPPGFFLLLARLFDPRYALPGTTGGIRLEAALACLLGGLYVLLKSRRPLAALGCAVAIAPTCLFFFTLPARFYEACRFVLRDFPISALYGQPGRISSVEPWATADLVISVYLTALVAILLAAFVAVTRRGALRPLVSRLLSMRAIVPASGAFLGACAARLITAPAPGSSAVASRAADTGFPAEGIAVFGISLAALLAGASFASGAARGRAGVAGAAAAALTPASAQPLGDSGEGLPERLVSVVLLTLALGLGAALGSAPLALLAGLMAIQCLDVLPPLSLGARPILGEGAWAAAILFAALAGASLFFGREAIVRMPPSLAMSLAATGALLRITARSGEGSIRVLRAVAAGMACLSLPLLLGQPRLALPLTLLGGAVALVVFAGEQRLIAVFVPVAAAGGVAIGGLLTFASPDSTERLFTESLRSPYLHFRSGEAARAQGNASGARDDYLAALARDPRFVPALTALGQLSLEQKDVAGAIENFRKAAEASPADSGARNNLGAALLTAGRTDEALVKFREAVELDPANCGALYNRAAALDRLGRSDEAIESWTSYLGVCEKRFEERDSVEPVRKRIEELRSGVTAENPR